MLRRRESEEQDRLYPQLQICLTFAKTAQRNDRTVASVEDDLTACTGDNLLTSFLMTNRPVTGAVYEDRQVFFESGPACNMLAITTHYCTINTSPLTVTRLEGSLEEKACHIHWNSGRSLYSYCLPIGRHKTVDRKLLHHLLLQKLHFCCLSMNQHDIFWLRLQSKTPR